MTFVPFTNGLKWSVDFDTTGQPWHITGFAFTADPTSPTQRSALLTNLIAWASAPVMIYQSHQTRLLGASCVDMSSISGGTLQVTLGTPVPGSDTNESNPINVCMVITLQTFLRGRSYRGRIYFSGLPITFQFDSVSWDNATVSTYESIGSQLITSLATGGQFLAIGSRFNGGVARTHGVLTPVETCRANARIASQRRRTGSD